MSRVAVPRVAVLGAGIQGSCVALELARRGCDVDLFDRAVHPMTGASRWNEGKIHLGFLYAMDPSERTAQVLIEGALEFWDAVAGWVGSSELGAVTAEPFVYAVHRDSMLDAEDVEAHLAQTARLYQASREDLRRNYLGIDSSFAFERLSRTELESSFDSSSIAAGFRTAERAIDPGVFADAFRNALAAERRIEFHGNHRVERVAANDGAGFGVHVVGERRFGPYSHVVNALWGDRLRIDIGLGLQPPRRWLHRYKLAVHIDSRTVLPLPSTTIVLGPFGDIVNFGDGRYYLSWYPTCRVGTSDAVELPGWSDPATDDDRMRIVDEVVAHLDSLVPGVAAIAVASDAVEVRGGVIFGWADSDIDDTNSGLHGRHSIGVTTHGAYHSIDTGKYSMAPLFALDVADRIRPLA